MVEFRRQVRDISFFWFTGLGVAGVTALVLYSIWSPPRSGLPLAELGSDAWWLIALFGGFSVALALLRFELTESIFVSISVSAFVAMVPLIGPVVSGWLAPTCAVVPRIFQIAGGRRGNGRSNTPLDIARALSLYGVYGFPVLVAGEIYRLLGGGIPLQEPSWATIAIFCTSALGFFVTNSLVMFFLMSLFGYEPKERVRLLSIDLSIYVVMLPYSLVLALSYGSMGFPALISLMLTGIVMNWVTRGLARSRESYRTQVQRMVSMSNIGRAISLGFSRDELLRTVYQECSKVVDTAMFTIALYDVERNELRFELIVDNGEMKPKERAPLGEGLTSWVVEQGKPLILGSLEEERERGLSSVDDGLSSESWLGVPMTVRDRVMGVISIQSWRRDAFRPEDLLMLTAVANQAAVALESLDLYSDLESLTLALEERVSERTKELREANLRLRTADRTKSQFLANMSHELRTPLNSIIGFSTVLLDRDRQKLAPRMKKFLENIHSAGTHLLELINDILDLSKIEAGRMAIDIREFDLAATVASVERVIGEGAREKGVNIVVEVDPAIGTTTLDEGRLKQILLNLLSNAVKFSDGGSTVKLSVSPLPEDQSPLGVESIEYRVEDAGIGIAKEELSLIFDKFYQTDPARRTKGGTGLGLSLVKNFVEMLGGSIDVSSESGRGSVFTVLLPKRAAEQSPRPAEKAVSAGQPGQ